MTLFWWISAGCVLHGLGASSDVVGQRCAGDECREKVDLTSLLHMRNHELAVHATGQSVYTKAPNYTGTVGDYTERIINTPLLSSPLRPYQEELDLCPQDTEAMMNAFVEQGFFVSHLGKGQYASKVFKLLGLKALDAPTLDPDSMDQFTMFNYFSMRQTLTSAGRTVNSSSHKVPEYWGDYETMTLGHLTLPVVEFDGYGGGASNDPPMPNGSVGFNHAMDPNKICLVGHALLELERNDWLNDTKLNRWELNTWQKSTRKAWLEELWHPYKLVDGTPAWPAIEVDWAAHFRKGDMWEDMLEQQLAFNNVGVHRVKTSNKAFGGESLPFVLGFNDPFSKFEVRPGFAKYGTDMYFTHDGMPALIVTPSGEEIAKGDKDWQYWKFVWRSCLVAIVTLQDHLHMAHYRVANVLASVTRGALPPNHVLRRLLTVFTFGTIGVNYKSFFALQDTRGVLSRALPFVDFNAVNDAVVGTMPGIRDLVDTFVNESIFNTMPDLIKAAPFFADGKLLFKEQSSLVAGYVDIFRSQLCDPETDKITDAHTQGFLHLFQKWLETSAYEPMASTATCAELTEQLSAYWFMVTSWHRHVGQIGDFAIDPDLIGLSWQEGEPFPRPMQAFQWSSIAAATAAPRPKLMEDYSHVFKGIDRQEDVASLWAKFHTNLTEVTATITARNKKRTTENWRSDPRQVESSLCV